MLGQSLREEYPALYTQQVVDNYKVLVQTLFASLSRMTEGKGT